MAGSALAGETAGVADSALEGSVVVVLAVGAVRHAEVSAVLQVVVEAVVDSTSGARSIAGVEAGRAEIIAWEALVEVAVVASGAIQQARELVDEIVIGLSGHRGTGRTVGGGVVAGLAVGGTEHALVVVPSAPVAGPAVLGAQRVQVGQEEDGGGIVGVLGAGCALVGGAPVAE